MYVFSIVLWPQSPFKTVSPLCISLLIYNIRYWSEAWLILPEFAPPLSCAHSGEHNSMLVVFRCLELLTTNYINIYIHIGIYIYIPTIYIVPTKKFIGSLALGAQRWGSFQSDPYRQIPPFFLQWKRGRKFHCFFKQTSAFWDIFFFAVIVRVFVCILFADKSTSLSFTHYLWRKKRKSESPKTFGISKTQAVALRASGSYHCYD